MFRFMVVNFILIFALTICVGISKIEAFTSLGEFCWQTDETESGDQIILKLVVSDVDDNILQCPCK